jgi:hypothetical protein
LKFEFRPGRNTKHKFTAKIITREHPKTHYLKVAGIYKAWKAVKLDLRKDHRSLNLAFNAADHDQGGTGIGQKDVRPISDVDWAGKLISKGSGAVG